jgi:glycosyltransferase involved in cell wall biosynthesis
MTTPPAFRHYFGRARWGDAVRSLRVSLLPVLPSLRRAARRSALVLASNRETARILEAATGRYIALFGDVGLPPEYVPASPPSRHAGPAITLLWVGQLIPRKALPLALEALARVKDLPVQLVVVGDGPLRREWESLARRFELDRRVRFLGAVPWERMPEFYCMADAFLFTSLRDSSGWVIFEAMAHALPILTLDHQGAALFVPPEAGIKAPVTTSAETVGALAEGIRRLVRDPAARLQMGEAAWAYARTQTWDRRAEAMSVWYEQCLRERRVDGLARDCPWRRTIAE